MPGTVFSVAPNGANIAYIDSGAPTNKDVYSTLLIIHGFLWNAGVFRKVIDNATAYGIRAIAINRRGYEESSPFTSEELGPLEAATCTPDDRRNFMAVQAVELADFIKQLIDHDMVSARGNDHGSLALLGWSLGNAFVCDFLSHVPSLPDGLSHLVKDYLRSFIVFDCPLDVLALPPPYSAYSSKVKEVMRIPDPIEASNFMADYISSSFEYPPFPGHLGADVLLWSDADRQTRYGPPHDRAIGKSIRIIEAEHGGTAFEASNEPNAMVSDMVVQVKSLMRGDLLPVTEAILFGDPEKTLWPGMRVEYAYCANSSSSCVYAGEASRTRFEAAVPNRKMKTINNANHFFHWVEPKRFLEEIVQLM